MRDTLKMAVSRFFAYSYGGLHQAPDASKLKIKGRESDCLPLTRLYSAKHGALFIAVLRRGGVKITAKRKSP